MYCVGLVKGFQQVCIFVVTLIGIYTAKESNIRADEGRSDKISVYTSLKQCFLFNSDSNRGSTRTLLRGGRGVGRLENRSQIGQITQKI